MWLSGSRDLNGLAKGLSDCCWNLRDWIVFRELSRFSLYGLELRGFYASTSQVRAEMLP